MKITTKGRYALRSIIHMAMEENPNPISIKNITEKEDISPIFLEQIFTHLKKANIVNSIRGAKGGFILARPIDEITVKDIFDAVDENMDITPCALGTEKVENCSRKDDCICTFFWQDTCSHLMDYFSGITLKSIIDKYSSKTPIEF